MEVCITYFHFLSLGIISYHLRVCFPNRYQAGRLGFHSWKVCVACVAHHHLTLLLFTVFECCVSLQLQ